MLRQPVNVGTRVERADQGRGTVTNSHECVYEDRATLVKRRPARWFLFARAATRNPGESRPQKRISSHVMSTDYDDRVVSLRTPPRIGGPIKMGMEENDRVVPSALRHPFRRRPGFEIPGVLGGFEPYYDDIGQIV